MTKIPPRIYWDAAAWIAYIKREMPTPDNKFKEPRFNMCRQTLQSAEKGELEIVTSAFTLAEVCKHDEISSPVNNLPAFFQQKYVLLVPADTQVGRKAQYLQLSGLIKRKPADALHIASALIANVPIMHTFDKYLLNLTGTLTLDSGMRLQIVMPTEEIPLPPLLEIAQGKDEPDDANATI